MGLSPPYPHPVLLLFLFLSREWLSRKTRAPNEMEMQCLKIAWQKEVMALMLYSTVKFLLFHLF